MCSLVRANSIVTNHVVYVTNEPSITGMNADCIVFEKYYANSHQVLFTVF